METIVVTGASGYIGGLVARASAQGNGPASVRCLVRTPAQARPFLDNGYQILVGDLTDPSVVEPLVNRSTVIVHAAAYMDAGSREDVFEMNVKATDRLARAASAVNAHLIFISSIEAYGQFAGRTLVEEEPYRPINHIYSESKMLGERAVADRYAAVGSCAYTILRPGMVYGEHSPYWTHRYLRMAREGRICVLGDGGRIFPVHEDDLVAAVASATRPEAAAQTFNIVHDEELTWWDWALAHHELAGRGKPRRRSALLLRLTSQLHHLAGKPGQQWTLEAELRRGSIPHNKAGSLLSWSPRSFGPAMASCRPQLSS